MYIYVSRLPRNVKVRKLDYPICAYKSLTKEIMKKIHFKKKLISQGEKLCKVQ